MGLSVLAPTSQRILFTAEPKIKKKKKSRKAFWKLLSLAFYSLTLDPVSFIRNNASFGSSLGSQRQEDQRFEIIIDYISAI